MRLPETCVRTLPQVMSPKELTTGEIATIPTISGSYLRTFINCTMYRDLGEQDQQAPVGYGRNEGELIQVQSLLDQKMAKMSPVKKMSYHQSKMHFDESMERNADSDLEDGEVRKLLTSSLCAQRASGRPNLWTFRKMRKMHKRLIHQRVEKLRETGCVVFTKTK